MRDSPAVRALLRVAIAVRFAALVLVMQLTVSEGWAQQRQVPVPTNARYGELKALRYPQVLIGDKVLRLGPGAKIYDRQNLIIMPAAAPSQASVLYRLDINGEISEMWLLTAEEAATAKRRAQEAAGATKP
jgi:hypothetical protein